MTSSVLLSLALFALVNSITPGPNNVMLTASGAAFGYRRTLPHMLGITLGVAVMLLLVGAGLGTVFETMPALYTALKYVGAAYLLYLAARIAGARDIESGETAGKPFTFLQAAAFQWVNPKAWIMAVGIVATYMPQAHFFANLAIAVVVMSLINFPSISMWTLCGTAVRRVLRKPQWIQWFNRVMALLLVCSLYPLVLPLFGA